MNDKDFSLDELSLDNENVLEGVGLGEDFLMSSGTPAEDLNANDLSSALQAFLGADIETIADASAELHVDDGSNLDLDFNLSEEEELEASTLLSTQFDMSKELLAYGSKLELVYQKIAASRQVLNTQIEQPTMSEFTFIANSIERQRIYSFFCTVLVDLTVDSRYSSFTEKQAYEYVLNELWAAMHYTPSVFADKLERIFKTYYSKNKKIARARNSAVAKGLAGMVDWDKLSVARTVYNINSKPFNTATSFLADTNYANSNLMLEVADYGEFMAELRQQHGRRSFSHRDVLESIIYFLTSDETLKLLNLTEEARIEFTLGELLRRFVQQELNDMSFPVLGLEKIAVTGFSKQLLGVLVRCLESAVKKQSFAAEILLLLMEIMYSNSMGKIGTTEFFEPFVVGIAQYLIEFSKNPAYVNPIYYSYIGDLSANRNGPLYELGYIDGDVSSSITSDSILCDVVGDSNIIYHIPLVYVESRSRNVICPPPEVVDEICKVTAVGHMKVSGNICYKYTPSFSWISYRGIASSSASKETVQQDTVIGQGSNPLLDTLLHYTNKFDTSGEQPRTVAIDAPNVCSLLGIQFSENQGISVLRLVRAGESQPLDLSSATCVIDRDESLILRYTSPLLVGEQVEIINKSEYSDLSKDQVQTADSGIDVVFSDIIKDKSALQIELKGAYYRSVTRMICSLNALDYDAELERVREVIVRDLWHVIRVDFLDEYLGQLVLQKYLELANEVDELGSFNFHSMQELCAAVFGEPNVLTGATKLTPDLRTALASSVATASSTSANLSRYLDYLDGFDFHLLALQICSRTELSQSGDMIIYRALHAIPSVHSRLRVLEDQMVLLHALREIDSDIASVLRKHSAIFNAYNTVCAKDHVLKVEQNLKTGMRRKEIEPCLHITKDVLFNTNPESCAILKYFVLERNAYGVLTTMEEIFARGVETYRPLYNKFCTFLFGEDIIGEISVLTERDFAAKTKPELLEEVFVRFNDDLLLIIEDGLISEVSTNVDLQVLKVFDIITAYGKFMFHFTEAAEEDYTDTTEFLTSFFTYVGSFLVSYSPIVGEAADDIDGGFDRYTAYLRHRKDYRSITDLGGFDRYTLRDLRLAVGVDSEITEGDNDS